jgi:hypothetical protein
MVHFHRTIWCYIPEDITLHNHWCENLKYYFKMNTSIAKQKENMQCVVE